MSKPSNQDIKPKDQTHNLVAMFDTKDEAWIPYLDVQGFLDFVNPIDGETTLSAREAEMFIRQLPFYKKTSLLKLASKFDEEPIEVYYLKQDDDIVVLNGLSDHIHEVNETGDINLNINNALDYLKFFSAFINDQETQEYFYIVENEDSEFLKTSSPYERKRILRSYEGPSVEETKNGDFKIKSRVIHCGELFDATYTINKNGDVYMDDDVSIGSI